MMDAEKYEKWRASVIKFANELAKAAKEAVRAVASFTEAVNRFVAEHQAAINTWESEGGSLGTGSQAVRFRSRFRLKE